MRKDLPGFHVKPWHDKERKIMSTKAATITIIVMLAISFTHRGGALPDHAGPDALSLERRRGN